MNHPSHDATTTGPSLWVVLARAYGSMAAFVESRVAAEGLCLSDFMVLEVLLHRGPLPISSIGARVLLANASMTSAVDRLEARTFVERQSSAGDRRARIVALTPQGRKFIAQLYERHAIAIEEMMSGIDAKERSQLRASLKKLGLTAQAALQNASQSEKARPVAERPILIGPNKSKPRATYRDLTSRP